MGAKKEWHSEHRGAGIALQTSHFSLYWDQLDRTSEFQVLPWADAKCSALLRPFFLNLECTDTFKQQKWALISQGRSQALSVSITLNKIVISAWHFPKQTQSRCPPRPHCAVKKFKRTF